MDPSSVAAPTRVFVLDDHDVIQRGIADLITTRSDLVLAGTAMTAAEAVTLVPDVAPDLLVFDVNLPDGNGVQVCRRLRSEMPQLRCLLMTAGTQEDARFAALLAGAAGYVTKHAPSDQILEALIRAARGDVGMDRSAAAQLLAHHPGEDADSPVAPRHLIGATELAELTSRQRQVLELVLRGRTDREIADQLAIAEPAVASEISVLFVTLDLRRRLRDAFDEASRIPTEGE
ncbi:response regulator [uncultured Friedmanniella sp.]|uniref:response regulator n=1 Tax=uncultured Friedmanniella sp. TaxID=335381 RepID=UPI0035CC7DB7